MKNVSTDKLVELVESYQNGNISYVMSEVKKLSRNDRARIIGVFRCYAGTKAAFEIADRIITNNF